MLSFFVYLVTAILCFYLGRREKNRQLQAVTRERDNWRLMFDALSAEHKETLETVREQQISLSMKEKSRKEQNEEILALKRKLCRQNTDKERKQIYECLYGLRRDMQQNYIQSLDSQLTLLEERHDAFIKKKYQPLDAKVEDLERRIEDVNDQALDLQSDLDDAHSRIDRVADDAWNAQMDADTANFENDDG